MSSESVQRSQVQVVDQHSEPAHVPATKEGPDQQVRASVVSVQGAFAASDAAGLVGPHRDLDAVSGA